MSQRVDVTNAESFRTALATLNGSTHGDTLAIYLALKKHQDELPTVGDGREGLVSGELEKLLDLFYTKRDGRLGRESGRVCKIFSGNFTQAASHGQNNWRDFFRYGLGIGCLAPEEQFTSEFLGQRRSDCPYLTRNSAGAHACSLHPKQTRYIRTLERPKFLKWAFSGKAHGTYRLVNLDDPGLMEFIRPLTAPVPLPELLIALYFAAPWSRRRTVAVEDFVDDFHFASVDEVDFLFTPREQDPAIQRRVQETKQDLINKLQQPFHLTEPVLRTTTTTDRLVRLRAFSEAVREAYNYSCAVCGLQVESIEGNWESQAAHIYDRALGGADDIRNGLALCRTHHWAFDNKLFTIDERYLLIWHPRQVGTKICREGTLHLPQGTKTWPALDALQKHQERTLALWHTPRRKRRRRRGGLSFP